jgi:hypothetical protein
VREEFNPKMTEEIIKDGLAFRANTLEELRRS